MYQSVVGLPGPELTAACLERYIHLLQSTARPDRIVVLVRSRRQGSILFDHLHQRFPNLSGPLTIETFVGFVGRVLAEHWGSVLQHKETLSASFAPINLTKDLTQYLMERACQLCPTHAQVFGTSPLRSYQVWDQLSSAAYIASASDLPLVEVGARLQTAWPDREDLDSLQHLGAVSCCAERLRAESLALGALDFGTQLALFSQVVLPLPQFWKRFDHLIVEQVEESSEVALKFLTLALERLRSLFLAYTVGGGFALTAVPQRVAQFVFRETSFTYLEPPTDTLAYLGQQLAQRLYPEFKNPVPLRIPATLPLIHTLSTETQLEAAEEMGLALQALLERGVDPAQIAVITPYLDAGIVFALQNRLGECVYPLGQFPALVKYPLIRALLTVLELGHAEWGLFPTLAELRVMLEVLLSLDPIRAQLLAEDVLDPVQRVLRSAESVRFPERIGFDAVRRYEGLRHWIHQLPTYALPLDYELRKLFAEMLASTLTRPEDQSLVQTLIDTATRFRTAFPHQPSQEFLVMIRSGQTATRGFAEPDFNQVLVIATPMAFLSQGLTVDYQFWFDITSNSWTRSAWRPLYNHRVLTSEWNRDVFDQTQDQQHQQWVLAKTMLNLCCHCRKGLWLIRSSFNGRGEENTTGLDQTILGVYRQLHPDPVLSP